MAWTPEQIVGARAILAIERNLSPKCEGCGYDANRPNCVNGGGCSRHEQDDVKAFQATIEEIQAAAGLKGENAWGWRSKIPLADLYGEITEGQLNLLMDLVDAGGKITSRSRDPRFDWLAARSFVSWTANDRWHVTISKRGNEYIDHMDTQRK